MGKKEIEYTSEGAKKVEEMFKRQEKELELHNKKLRAKNRKTIYICLVGLFFYFIFAQGAISIFGKNTFTVALLVVSFILMGLILAKFEK